MKSRLPVALLFLLTLVPMANAAVTVYQSVVVKEQQTAGRVLRAPPGGGAGDGPGENGQTAVNLGTFILIGPNTPSPPAAALLRYDDVTRGWELEGAFSFSSGTLTSASIIGAASAGSLPQPGFRYDWLLTHSGTGYGTLAGTGTFTREQAQDLADGLMFLSLQDSGTGASYRGQLQPIPEPGSMAVILSSACAMAGFGRSRRRSAKLETRARR